MRNELNAQKTTELHRTSTPFCLNIKMAPKACLKHASFITNFYHVVFAFTSLFKSPNESWSASLPNANSKNLRSLQSGACFWKPTLLLHATYFSCESLDELNPNWSYILIENLQVFDSKSIVISPFDPFKLSLKSSKFSSSKKSGLWMHGHLLECVVSFLCLCEIASFVFSDINPPLIVVLFLPVTTTQLFVQLNM